MNPAKPGLLAALVVINVAFVLAWVRDARHRTVRTLPTAADIAIGFVTDFLDAALLTAAMFFLMANLGAFPAGGTGMNLVGWRFGLAVCTNCVLGALMSVGIGAYAPSMVLLALLGLHPLGAFPIMMGTCGLVQPAASLRFFKTGRYAFGPALGLTIGGTVGVLIAIFIVRQLPLIALRWLVMVVVMYAALSMLRSALRDRVGALATPAT